MSEPTAVAVVGTHFLTKEQAGTPPVVGEVWSEQLQRFVPRGQQFAIDQAERENNPTYQLAQYEERRQALLRFIGGHLVEAEYDEKGYPLKGKMHDFYILPNYDKKAITKGGASKVMAFLRHRVAERAVTHAEFTKEHGSARVRVMLTDAMGQPVGAYEAACSTSEGGFRAFGARKKYGEEGHWEGKGKDSHFVIEKPADLRAAENDVVARAGKRAVVGAEIIAASLEEIFDLERSTDTGDEDDDRENGQQGAEEGEERTEAETVVTPETLWPSENKASKWYGKTVREIGASGFEWLKDELTQGKKTDQSVYRFVIAALAALGPSAPAATPTQPAASPASAVAAPDGDVLAEGAEVIALREELKKPEVPDRTFRFYTQLLDGMGENVTLADIARIRASVEKAVQAAR